MMRKTAALALVASAAAFTAPACTFLPGSRSAFCNAPVVSLRATKLARSGLALRMADDIPSVDRSDENKKEEEVVPSTVLSDDDLNARIAELGLGKEGGVEDKSTGEDPTETMRPMERVQKEAVKIGTTAIGSTFNAAINVLNTIEAPISEEEYAKLQADKEKDKQPMAEEERTMINQGGLAVVLPVALVGAAFVLWGLGGELGWF
jgi:hypothetical protein